MPSPLSRFRSRSPDQTSIPPPVQSPILLLGAVQALAQNVVRVAEEITTYRAELEKIAGQTTLLAHALTGYVDGLGVDHVEPAVLKRMLELRSELQATLDDLTRLASRQPPRVAQAPRRAASTSPPPPGSPATPPPRSLSPLKRALGSIAGEFEVARCAERLEHAVKVFTALGIVPPAYDSPSTQVPDRVPLNVWNDSGVSLFRSSMLKGGMWFI